jgi:uncharacterized membrane protein YcaP (DUF421 family)
MGKKSISKMNTFNLINYMVIAIIACLTSLNVITSFSYGLIALFIWSLIPIALDYASMKSKRVNNWINGKEIILIKDGKVMEENLKHIKLTGEALLKGLRDKNVFGISEVEFAVMEHTGDINVLLKSNQKPLTPKDMGQRVSPKIETQTVILDGKIINESLNNLGLSNGWLNEQLSNIGVSLDNVFVGQVDSNAELYVDLFDDLIQMPKPQERELLYASIEKCQADLVKYSMECNNAEAKAMYTRNAAKLKQVMNKLEPYLLK